MEDNKKKVGAYASLTGFRRAVPIILMALAVFTALCFITKNTGAFGAAISNLFLGLFSVGGYFIPAALAIHAVFYPSDVLKKRVASRVIFTVITVMTISTLTHTIATINDGMSFSASAFYSGGKNVSTGGFIGGALSFLLTKIFGTVGVIIIAIALFAIYIAYYFSSSRSFLSRVLLKILTAISNFFTGISDKRKARKEEKENERRELERERIDEILIPLAKDSFFNADDGMKEMKIPELEIHETRDDSELEKNPHLQEKVFHKSAADTYTITSTPTHDQEPRGEAKQTKRTVNMDYSTVDSVHELADSVEDTVFTPRDNDIIYDTPTHSTCNADDVFSSRFEPFNLKINEELSNKPSSKIAKEEPKSEGITEVAEPINEITEQDLQKARERADFEMRKKASLEAAESYERAREELERRKAAQQAQMQKNFATAESTPKNVEFETEFEFSVPDKSAAEAHAAQMSEPEIKREYPDTESAASEYAPSKTTGYENYTTAPVTKNDYAQETRRAEFTQSAAAPAESTQPTPSAAEFKPYTTPAAEIEKNTEETEESHSEENLRMTRSMLEPTFTTEIKEEIKEEPQSAPALDFESEDSGALTFEFDTDEEDEDIQPTVCPPEEETADEPQEIPVEKQNPEVMRQREYFNFFNETEDKEEAEEYDSEVEDNEEEDEEEEETTVYAGGYDSFNPPENDEDEEERDEYFADNEPIARKSYEDVEDDEPDDEDEEEYASERNSLPFDAPTRIVPPAKPVVDEYEPIKPELPDYSDYQHPPIDLLIKGKVEEDLQQEEEEKNQNAEKLVDALSQFNVRISIKGIDRGPRITRYEIVPARGVKVSSVTRLFDDIALNLGVEGMRMEAPIPGKSAIGVEIPNKKPSTVLLRDLVESEEFINAPSKTLSCLGNDVTGNPVYADIAKMPHVLVAGATGMGKSVCINSILISILYKARPDEVKFIMIDPKKVEFNGYNGIPHLLIPVVTDVKQAAGALMWAVEQMEKRYDLMEALEVRKLDAYNDKVRENPELGEPLPKIIIVIDELNDIMLQVRKPAEELIMSIAQKARAAGIHLIIGTQRPSVDVITGVIKANIPSRISCKVASYNDSKTILEQAGAERLLNNGDMLYISAGAPKALRVQGAFVSDSEVSAIMGFLKKQAKGAVYDSQALEEINRAAQKCSNKGKGGDADEDDDSHGDSVGIFNDPKFIEAVEIAIRSKKVSTSLLQRKISVGYSKAAKYIDAMEAQGFVSEPNGSKPREVLISMEDWHELLSRREI